MQRATFRLLRSFAVASVVLACFLGPAQAAAAASITINPGAYQGGYYIAPFSGFSTGPTTFDLADGTYQLDLGASVAGSAFDFTVTGGKVVSVTNSSADPSPDGSTLTLRNTNVTINAGAYTGRYYLTSFGAQEFVGTQTVVLVPDIVYSLDGSAHVVATIAGTPTASDFLFDVDASGAVTIFPGSAPSAPATAAGNTINLNSVTIQLDVSPATAAYRVCSQLAPIVDHGTITVTVIPGLVNCVSDGTNAGYFVASPSGVQPGSVTVGALTALLTTSNSATAATLVSLTTAFVTSSAAYPSLPAPLQAAINRILQRFAVTGTLTAGQMAAYIARVDVLVRFGLLTPDQAAVLKALAARV